MSTRKPTHRKKSAFALGEESPRSLEEAISHDTETLLGWREPAWFLPGSWAMKRIRGWLTAIGVSTSHPLAFVVVGLYAVFWMAFDPRSFGWQSIATIATWIMTLFIQRAEHRDTQAIHAKLDELLRVEGEASNELTRLDQKEPEEIEKHREKAQQILQDTSL